MAAEHALPNAHNMQSHKCTLPTPRSWRRFARRLRQAGRRSLLYSATGAATQAQTLQALADVTTQRALEPSGSCAVAELPENSFSKPSGLGAGMVLLGACHLPYDCHYISGNYKMKARTDALKGMLTKLGMSPERFRVEYVSAAEGIHYAEVIKEIDSDMKALGKEKIQAENAKLKPILENMLKRKK